MTHRPKPTPIMVACFLALVSLAPAASSDDLVSAANPDAILDIAKGFGSATPGQDSQNDPVISGRIEGIKYVIYFYGCDEGTQCDDIQFTAGWRGTRVSLDKINEWNKSTRFGKAYLDKDGDPTVEMSVNLDHGVTAKNLEDTFQWWSAAMRGFEKTVITQ